eukprot:TRINITY_DN14802_c0_g1_i1.p4 TRINITY_DN14802_c0_g1~~TRINITY_DN14802_c0_g1_i1.p4  ORF type:complete len:142 (+),score=35.69 TRINITY_DN14802_c0_g1_i1:339-764(+)
MQRDHKKICSYHLWRSCSKKGCTWYHCKATLRDKVPEHRVKRVTTRFAPPPLQHPKQAGTNRKAPAAVGPEMPPMAPTAGLVSSVAQQPLVPFTFPPFNAQLSLDTLSQQLQLQLLAQQQQLDPARLIGQIIGAAAKEAVR